MTALVDIVNFNADASCLGCGQWFEILQGAEESAFCRWLSLYVRYEKPMLLGLTGATVSDLVAHNPEAIRLIRRHPQIFQILLRPYAHDLAFLRTRDGFRLNLSMGHTTITEAFGGHSKIYLPPRIHATQ